MAAIVHISVAQPGPRANEIIVYLAGIGSIFQSAQNHFDLYIQSGEVRPGEGQQYVLTRLDEDQPGWADHIGFERAYGP